ncbi:hypothetical protein [Synechococcus sp. H60.4]
MPKLQGQVRAATPTEPAWPTWPSANDNGGIPAIDLANSPQQQLGERAWW